MITIILMLLAFFVGYLFGGRVVTNEIHSKLISGETVILNGDYIHPTNNYSKEKNYDLRELQ